ncbi:SCO family protein [Thermus aquaticus]|jgi:protein SCO1/2|uniref:SCO1/SenC n=2 Tax=Thermus aquaticus TaxID=271 RepID=A0A0N0BLB0_THEAQ|nr:SCO family protein [Thermus aquaticus]ALJ91955.1 cytochrome oxidase biogenesis protein Sco1/SenC/PrrC, putative copper metallochaperone [Thermus aquaticus Y51MC23]KOX89313.1 SCO1/SenC [Thermus aquaticus]
MKRFWPAFLILGLLGLGYLLVPKGSHSFFGTRLLNPKPVDFTLEGPKGPVRLADFRDKLVLIFFGFVHCPDVCPTTMISLKQVYENLSPEEQRRVQVIFISVDPERDTPEIADQYAKAFHPAFLGLTGSPEEVQEVARAFGVYYQKTAYRGPGAYLVDHTATTFVVQGGRLVLLLSPDKLNFAQNPGYLPKVVADLRALL